MQITWSALLQLLERKCQPSACVGIPHLLTLGEKTHTGAALQIFAAADVLHILKPKNLPGLEAGAKGTYGKKGVSTASEQGPGLSLSLLTMAAQALLALSQERLKSGRSD